MYPSLKGKVAVISGATGGLGPAVVTRFHAEGAHLVLLDRGQAKLAELFGNLANTLLMDDIDVTDEKRVAHMAEIVAEQYVKIDILINIAGGYRAGTPVSETDLSTWEFLMNLNAKSVFLMSRALAPLLKSGGSILNIGAANGLAGTKNSAAYSASKAAVFRLTESLSAELKPQGVRVNAVYPKIIDTPTNRAAMPNADYDQWVTPESLAGVLAFLASDEARDITGTLLPLMGR